MAEVIKLVDESATFAVRVLHRLTAVDDARGFYRAVKCRVCAQEFSSPTKAARTPCPGPKETTDAPAG